MSEKKIGIKIAILCTTKNGDPWIAEQVESMLCQSGLVVDIFFRDDQSTDGTADWLKAKSQIDRRVHILSTSGKFGSAAMNFFRLFRDVNFDNFDYVALADQDDIWTLDKLLRAVTCLQKEGCEGYSSDLIAFDNKRRRSWYLKKSSVQQQFDYLFKGASAGCTYVLTQKAAQLVKARLVTNQEYCHSKLSHDWLIYAICRAHGLAWFQDTEARIFYRQHGGNQYGALPGASGIIERAKKVQSGWYRDHVIELKNFLLGTSGGERAVFLAIERYGYKDRIWLVRNAYKFRRTYRDILLLRIAIILGLF